MCQYFWPPTVVCSAWFSSLLFPTVITDLISPDVRVFKKIPRKRLTYSTVRDIA